MNESAETRKRMNSTYFGLLAEFGTSEIPLELICEKYFGCELPRARARGARKALPVTAYRPVNSQKSGYLVSAAELAEHLDRQKEKAAMTLPNMVTNGR